MVSDLDFHFFTLHYKKAFEELKATFYSNIPITTPTGRHVYIGGWIIPLMEENEFNGMICTIRDTTRSHTLSDILTQTIDTCQHGVGIIQQTTSGEVPAEYFSNNKFLAIFDLEDLAPTSSTVPFIELLEILKTKIKNVDEWTRHIQDAFEGKVQNTDFILHLKNGKSYRWKGSPLRDNDDRPLGRMIMIDDA